MTLGPQEAVKRLINGVIVAQKRGAYELEEASALYEAIKSLTTPPPQQAPPKTEGNNQMSQASSSSNSSISEMS